MQFPFSVATNNSLKYVSSGKGIVLMRIFGFRFMGDQIPDIFSVDLILLQGAVMAQMGGSYNCCPGDQFQGYNNSMSFKSGDLEINMTSTGFQEQNFGNRCWSNDFAITQ